MQRRAAERERRAAEQAKAEAEQARVQIEREAQQIRQRLLDQLNQVLQTRETARAAWLVDTPDVLLDKGKHTLKAGLGDGLQK